MLGDHCVWIPPPFFTLPRCTVFAPSLQRAQQQRRTKTTHTNGKVCASQPPSPWRRFLIITYDEYCTVWTLRIATDRHSTSMYSYLEYATFLSKTPFSTYCRKSDLHYMMVLQSTMVWYQPKYQVLLLQSCCLCWYHTLFVADMTSRQTQKWTFGDIKGKVFGLSMNDVLW
jgi:hypothetical protein